MLGKVIPELERRMLGDFPDRLAKWRVAAEIHAAAAGTGPLPGAGNVAAAAQIVGQ